VQYAHQVVEVSGKITLASLMSFPPGSPGKGFVLQRAQPVGPANKGGVSYHA
jgi:hypothetical protein